MSRDYDDDGTCWNCFGEGVIYDCFEEYACIDPEGGCDLCMRRCDICHPRPASPELKQILADALAASGTSGSAQDPQGLDPEGTQARPDAQTPASTKDTDR